MNAFLESITDIQGALAMLASELEAVKKCEIPSRRATILVMKLAMNAEHAANVTRELVRETIGSSPSIKILVK